MVLGSLRGGGRPGWRDWSFGEMQGGFKANGFAPLPSVYCFNLLPEGFLATVLYLHSSVYFSAFKVEVLKIKANISRCQWHPLPQPFLSKNLLLSSSFSPLDPETAFWGFCCFWKATFPPATFKRLTLTFPWTYWQPLSSQIASMNFHLNTTLPKSLPPIAILNPKLYLNN